jgi:hypothetical protein
MRTRNALSILLVVAMVIATPMSAMAQVDATWNGQISGEWLEITTLNWTGGVPNAADAIARFDEGGITKTVDMNGQAITVQDMFISGLADGYDITDVATGGSLTAGTITHSATGTNTISGAIITSGAITVSAGQLNLTGANTIGGAVNVTGGTLGGNGTSLANSTITLSGGTLDASGAGGGSYVMNQLRLTRYNSGTNNNSPAELDDGIDGNGLNGGVYTLAPDAEQFHSADLNAPILGGADNYVEMFDGVFIPPQTGTYNFQQEADDWEAVWIDFNQNGEFEASNGENILLNVPPEGWNVTKNATTPIMTAGAAYGFAAVFREDGGGDFGRFRVDIDLGAGTDYQFIDPGDAANQNNWWATGSATYGDITMATTDLDVTAASTLVANSDNTAAFGALSLADTLEITNMGAGDGVTVTGITVAAGSTSGITTSRSVTSAGALDIGAGASFAFSGDTLTAASTNMAGAGTITVNSTLNGGALTLGGDLTAAGAGPQNYTSMAVPAGTTTIATPGGATITTLAFNDGDVANTVNITGTGTLAIDGSAGGAINADDTAFNVGAGTKLVAAAAAAGNMGAAGTSITLDGGTFETEGEFVIVNENGLRHYGYHTGPNGVLDLNNNGGMMGGGDPTQGPTFYGEALLTAGPANRGLDFNDDADFQNTGVIASNRNDNYSNLFVGYIVPDVTGNWILDNEGDDDRNGMWLDLDQDGIFESSTAGLGSNRGEQLAWEDGGDKTVALTAGEEYLVAFIHSEGGGGSNIMYRVQGPAGSTVNSRRTIIPNGTDAAQVGIWQYKAPGYEPIDMSTTDFTVTASSGIAANTSTTATFGALTLTDGMLNVTGVGTNTTFGAVSAAAGATTGVTANSGLTLGALTIGAGADVTIGGTNVTAPSIEVDTSATIRVIGDVNPGTYSQLAPTALTVAGNGSLDLSGLGAAAAAGSSFTTQESATLKLGGATPLGGSTADLNLDGGAISIDGHFHIVYAPRTYDFESGLTGWNILTAPNGGNTVYNAGANPTNILNNTTHTSQWINTWHGSDGNNDNRTGIIRTDEFFIGSEGGGEQITLQVAGGDASRWGWTGDPDNTIGANIATVTLEHEVAPGDWEVVTWSNRAGDGWAQQLKTWDVSSTGFDLVGEKVRVGIYDTRNGGNWGFVTVDDINIGSAGEGVIDPINMGGTDLNVTNASTITLNTPQTATLGTANLINGILTVDGPDAGTTFAAINVTDAADTGLAATNPINITAGVLTVTNTTNSPTQNFTLGGTIALPGTLTLGDNVKVSVDGGAVTAASTAFTGTTNTFNFTNNGTLAAGINDGGIAKTFNVEGDGTGGLSLGAGTVADQSTFNLNAGGTMVGQGAQPLGALGTTLNMNGGTLDVSIAGIVEMPESISAHFAADQGVTVDGSGTVQAWADISGNSNDAVRRNGAPAFIESGFNGLPEVSFDSSSYGNSDLIINSTLFAKDIYIVWRNADGTLRHNSLFGTTVGRGSTFIMDDNATTFHSNRYPESWSRDGVLGSGWSIAPVDDEMLLRVVVNDEDLAAESYLISGVDGGGRPADWSISEIMAFDSKLSTQEENDVSQYLALKYGLATPYTGVGVGKPVTAGDVDMVATNVTVTGDSAIQADVTGNVAIGALTFGDGGTAGGILSIAGTSGNVSFTSATVANVGGSDMGFNNDSNVQLLGGLDFNNLAATIVKDGEGDLVLLGAKTQNSVAGSTYEVRGGRLIGSHASNPYVTGTTLNIAGGEVVLASDLAANTFDNPVVVDGGGILTAGKGGLASAVDGAAISLDNSAGATGIQLNSGILVLQTTDAYTLDVLKNVEGSGGIDIQGDVTLSQPSGVINIGSLTVSSGVLTTAATIGLTDLTVNSDFDATGDTITTSGIITLNAGEYKTDDNVVAKGLRMAGGTLHRAAGGTGVDVILTGSGSELTLTGSDLDMTAAAVGGVAGTLTVDNNTVITVDGQTLTFDNDIVVDRVNMGTGGGGTIIAPGRTITSDTSYNEIESFTVGEINAIHANLAGTGEMRLNHQHPASDGNANNTPLSSLLMTTADGNHEYNGNTWIDRGGLNIGNASVNTLHATNGGYIRLDADQNRHTAQLMGYGALNLTIGTGQGQIYWDNEGGGFAAYGGDLTVTLTPQDSGVAGDPLSWNSNTSGFNSRRLKFGHYEATNMVELTNDIAMNGSRLVHMYDNPTTDQDVAKLSGILSSGAGDTLTIDYRQDNAWDWNIYQTGTLWLANAANTYAHTTMNVGVLRLGLDGAGLGTGKLYFRGRHGDPSSPNVIEAHGTFSRTIGQDNGEVYWSTDGNDRGGGFAAWGPEAAGNPLNDLTVTLVRGDGATWDHDGDAGAVTPEVPLPRLDWNNQENGFRDRRLMLGSPTANGVVTLTNDIDGNAGNRELWVWDNASQTTDHAVLGGTLNNFNRLWFRGDGEIRATGSQLTDIQDLRIDGQVFSNRGMNFNRRPSLIIAGDYDHATNSHVQAYNADMVVNGNMIVQENVNVWGDATLTVNGDLQSTNGRIWVEDDAFLEVTGDIRTMSGNGDQVEFVRDGEIWVHGDINARRVYSDHSDPGDTPSLRMVGGGTITTWVTNQDNYYQGNGVPIIGDLSYSFADAITHYTGNQHIQLRRGIMNIGSPGGQGPLDGAPVAPIFGVLETLNGGGQINVGQTSGKAILNVWGDPSAPYAVHGQRLYTQGQNAANRAVTTVIGNVDLHDALETQQWATTNITGNVTANRLWLGNTGSETYITGDVAVNDNVYMTNGAYALFDGDITANDRVEFGSGADMNVTGNILTRRMWGGGNDNNGPTVLRMLGGGEIRLTHTNANNESRVEGKDLLVIGEITDPNDAITWYETNKDYQQWSGTLNIGSSTKNGKFLVTGNKQIHIGRDNNHHAHLNLIGDTTPGAYALESLGSFYAFNKNTLGAGDERTTVDIVGDVLLGQQFEVRQHSDVNVTGNVEAARYYFNNEGSITNISGDLVTTDANGDGRFEMHGGAVVNVSGDIYARRLWGGTGATGPVLRMVGGGEIHVTQNNANNESRIENGDNGIWGDITDPNDAITLLETNKHFQFWSGTLNIGSSVHDGTFSVIGDRSIEIGRDNNRHAHLNIINNTGYAINGRRIYFRNQNAQGAERTTGNITGDILLTDQFEVRQNSDVVVNGDVTAARYYFQQNGGNWADGSVTLINGNATSTRTGAPGFEIYQGQTVKVTGLMTENHQFRLGGNNTNAKLFANDILMLNAGQNLDWERGILSPGVDANGDATADTLTITGPVDRQVSMWNAANYEWNLDGAEGVDSDLINLVDIKLHADNWVLTPTPLDGGTGFVSSLLAEIDLFTYNTDGGAKNLPTIDWSVIDADPVASLVWDHSNAEVVHDAIGQRFYLTGLMVDVAFYNVDEFTWDQDASSEWLTPANWDVLGLDPATDPTTLDRANVLAGTATVNTTGSAHTLAINTAGTVAVQPNAVLTVTNDLLLDAGGTLTLIGSDAANMAKIASVNTLAMDGGAMTLDNAELGARFVNLDGGAVTLANTVTIGGNVSLNNGALLIDGTTALTVDDLNVAAGTTLDVLTGGVLNTADLNTAGATTVAGALNSATINVTDGTTDITGSVNATTLNVSGGATDLTGSTGSIGTTNVTGGSLTLASPSIGALNASAGVVNIAGAGVGNLAVSGSAAVSTTAIATIADLTQNGGTVDLAAGGMTATTAAINAGTLDASANALSIISSVTIGDNVAAATDLPFNMINVTGSDVVAGHTLTLNGGTMTVSGDVSGVSALPSPGDILAHYKLDGDLTDSSGNGAPDAGLGGDAAYIAGRVGAQGVTMDGTGDFLDIPVLNGGVASNGITYAFWMNLNDTALGAYDAVMDHDGWAGGRIHLAIGADKLLQADFNGGGGKRYSVSQIPNDDDNWYYIIYTAQSTNAGGNGDVDYYLDMELDGTLANDAHYANVVGTRTVDNSVGRQMGDWQGRGLEADIDDVVIYNRALTQLEAQALYESSLANHIAGDPEIDLSTTTIRAAASGTALIQSPAPLASVTLAGVETANGATLTVAGEGVDYTLGNLTMEGASMVRTTIAADTQDVEVATATVTLSGGMNYLGDALQLGDPTGDSNSTNLTLSDGAIIDWTFDGSGGNDSFLDVKGNITLAGTLTVNILDGIGTAGTEDIFIMMARGTIFGDVNDVTIDKPAGWEWDSFAIEQRSPSTWALVLKNAVFGVTEQDPGDTNNDGFVDDLDLANFQLAFGLAGADLIAEGFTFDPDFDNDGDADLDDFVTLRQFFGTNYNDAPAMPDLSQTPEPATMSLLALGALAILRRRRRK